MMSGNRRGRSIEKEGRKDRSEDNTELRDMITALSESQNKQIAALSESQNKQFDKIFKELGEMKLSLKSTHSEVENLKVENKKQSAEIKVLSDENLVLKSKLNDLALKFDDIENRQRQNNLIFQGLDVADNKFCEQKVKEFIKDNLLITDDIKFAKVHKLGNPDNRHADIIARFEFYSDRSSVWKERENLKGSKFFIKEDFSSEVVYIRNRLFPYMKAAHNAGKKAWFSKDKLFIEGTSYSIGSDFPYIPEHTQVTDDYIFFHSRLSPFSNFYPVELVIDDVKFNCVEQFYQVKCMEFHGHDQAARCIMYETDPAKQKLIAKRAVKKQYPAWQEESVKVMKKALECKFSPTGHPELTEQLTQYQQTFVECNKWDSHFAIGLSLHNSEKSDRTKWRGDNKLGYLLTNLRDSFE